MSETFKRTIEDFECLNCGAEVVGDGYTNHCPKCLYSLHVDISPGDRKANCKGLMEPIDIAPKGDHWVITHICKICGHKMATRSKDGDNVTDFISNLPPRFPED